MNRADSELSSFLSNRHRIDFSAAKRRCRHAKHGACILQMYAWSVASAQLETGPLDYQLKPGLLLHPPYDKDLNRVRSGLKGLGSTRLQPVRVLAPWVIGVYVTRDAAQPALQHQLTATWSLPPTTVLREYNCSAGLPTRHASERHSIPQRTFLLVITGPRLKSPRIRWCESPLPCLACILRRAVRTQTCPAARTCPASEAEICCRLLQSGAAEACILHYTYGQDLDEDGAVFSPRDCPGTNCTRGAWHWDKRDYAQEYPPRDMPLPGKSQVGRLISHLLLADAPSHHQPNRRAAVLVSRAVVAASITFQ